MFWSVIVFKLCIKTSNIGRKIMKIGKQDLCVCAEIESQALVTLYKNSLKNV